MTNSFKHFEQPRLPLWEKNPHNFRVAGISAEIDVSIHLTDVNPNAGCDFISTPCYSSNNSSIRGFKNEFTVSLGSLGPGIHPKIMILLKIKSFVSRQIFND